MAKVVLGARDLRTIERLLAAYADNKDRVSTFRNQILSALSESPSLSPHVHSYRSRLKDPEHLQQKLERKLLEAKAQRTPFDILPENLLTKVTDLAGIRILHLYTRQIRQIDAALKDIFDEQRYELIEGPFARTWDDEYRAFFEECGIETQKSETLYTSVHYVLGSSSRTPVTCEIQVRTLSEEVWGEVDHTFNYPVPTPSLACGEQIKVLARVTSSATRLVDSIFRTLESESGLGVTAVAGPVPVASDQTRVRKGKSRKG